jgi:hypothetical protein
MHCDYHVRAATNLQHQLLDLQLSMRREQLTRLSVMYDVLCAACTARCCDDGTMHPTHLINAPICKHVSYGAAWANSSTDSTGSACWKQSLPGQCSPGLTLGGEVWSVHSKSMTLPTFRCCPCWAAFARSSP